MSFAIIVLILDGLCLVNAKMSSAQKGTFHLPLLGGTCRYEKHQTVCWRLFP
jgi:hypothetical protein